MRAIRAAIILLSLAHAAAAAEPTQCVSSTGRTVSVTGSAAVRLPPDRASFSVGVETMAKTVSETYATNDAKLTAVLAALKGKGVEPKQVQTSNLDIASREVEGQFQGFRVSNLVTVTTDKPATVGDILQAAVAAGANQAGQLRFFVADRARVQSRGLELAFQDARTKAETMARLSHKALGDVVCVSEGPSWMAAGFTNNTYNFYAAGPSIEAGSENVPFSLAVVFELK